MKLTAIIKTAFNSVGANKIRSVLTTLGIVIGISAVIAMLSVGRGAEAQILEQIQGLGANTITVIPVGGFSGPTSRSNINALVASRIDNRVVERLDNPVTFPELAAISPEISKLFPVSYRSRTETKNVYGVTEDFFEVFEATMSSGRSISADDNAKLRRVVVLGPDIDAELFGENESVGKDIKIGDASYTVIGVMEEKSAEIDDRLLVPLKTATNILIGEKDYSQLFIKVSSDDLVNQAANKIEDELLEFYRVTDVEKAPFTLVTAAELLSLVGDITGIFTTLLASIAGISLLVGGIGIMNIMLVSVTERTREIGLRKAVGAKESAIMIQFLAEALLLTVIGGVIGIVLGFTFALLISELGGIPALFTLDAIILATSVSAVIGITFGFYPAYRAAKLNPIDALRYE